VRDAGPGSEEELTPHQATYDCIGEYLADTENALREVRNAYEAVQVDCLLRSRANPRVKPGPDDPCGAWDPHLWASASRRLTPLLSFATRSDSSPLRSEQVLADVDCTEMSGEDFAAATHYASEIGPAASFRKCALRRMVDDGREGPVLWSLIRLWGRDEDVAGYLESISDSFSDDRTRSVVLDAQEDQDEG